MARILPKDTPTRDIRSCRAIVVQQVTDTLYYVKRDGVQELPSPGMYYGSGSLTLGQVVYVTAEPDLHKWRIAL